MAPSMPNSNLLTLSPDLLLLSLTLLPPPSKDPHNYSGLPLVIQGDLPISRWDITSAKSLNHAEQHSPRLRSRGQGVSGGSHYSASHTISLRAEAKVLTTPHKFPCDLVPIPCQSPTLPTLLLAQPAPATLAFWLFLNTQAHLRTSAPAVPSTRKAPSLP